MRYIPKISIFEGIAFQTINYKKNVYLGDPINICKILADQGSQEIIINCVDNSISYDIKSALSVCSSPVTIGGNFNVEDKIDLISMGTEKIIFADSIWKNRQKLNKYINKLGSQAICASVDYIEEENKRFIVTGKFRNEIVCELKEGIKVLCDLNCGEILFSNITRNGKRTGLDYNVTEFIDNIINIPILLSGGYDNEYNSNLKYNFDGIVSSTHCFLYGVHNAPLINYPDEFSVLN